MIRSTNRLWTILYLVHSIVRFIVRAELYVVGEVGSTLQAMPVLLSQSRGSDSSDARREMLSPIVTHCVPVF